MRGTVLSALLGFAITALPMAPVIHVHRTHDTDGHDHVIAHTHGEDHHRHVDAVADHQGPEIDHDDSVLLAFDLVLGVPHDHVVVTPAISTPVMIDAPPMVIRGHVAEFVERLIHGPPRAPSDVRGPPVLSLL